MWDFHIAHVYSLWQELSRGTIIFYLVTLNFNLGHNFQTRILVGMTFIVHMCIPCDKTFHMVHVP